MSMDEMNQCRTNRSWLNNQNEFDLMTKLQERLDILLKGQNPCSIYILTGRNFISDENHDYCLKHECNKCIQLWLNRNYR